MQSRSTFFGTSLWKHLTAAAAAIVLTASVGLAQKPADSETRDERSRWQDAIDEDDVRVLGYVGEVGDEIFELRAHEALYLFEIPEDPDQAADVRTGERVQVWYDPEEYERDGATYYRVVHVMITQSMDTDDTETSDRPN